MNNYLHEDLTNKDVVCQIILAQNLKQSRLSKIVIGLGKRILANAFREKICSH